MSVEVRAHTGAAVHMGHVRSAKAMRWGTWYTCEHRLRTMNSYLTSIIVGSFFNPLMYLFALGVGIGSYIDANAGGQILGGISYLTFVGPALLASSAMTVVFDETSFPVMGGFKWSREFWAMNAAPLTGRQIANGVLLAAFIRVFFTVGIFWCFLALFGALPAPTALVALLPAMLGGMSLGTVLMWVASSLEDDDGWFPIINRLVIAPMFLFSGTFFPLEQIPLYLQWIGWISPLWHATQLGRVFAYGMVEPLWLSTVHGLYLGSLGLVALRASWQVFTRRLAK